MTSDPLEETLRRTLAEHDRDVESSASPVFLPPAQPERQQRRGRSLAAGLLVAAAVTAVGFSASMLGSAGTDANPRPLGAAATAQTQALPTALTTEPPTQPAVTDTGANRSVSTAPPKFRDGNGKVTYAGITFQVPSQWDSDDVNTFCAGQPDRDFVLLRTSPKEPSVACGRLTGEPIHGIWVIAADVSSSWLDGPAPTEPITLADNISGFRGVDKVGSTVLYLPSHKIYLKIRADQEVADQILASIRVAD